MMMILPMFNVIKLLCITTILVFAFIATTLLIYGMSGASACPTHWERDTYGGCSIPFGDKSSANKPVDSVSLAGREISLVDLKKRLRKICQGSC